MRYWMLPVGVAAATLGLIGLVSGVIPGTSREKIDAGYAGLKINNYGSEETRGVENAEVVYGRVWYNGYTHDVVEYPTFAQEYQFTNNADTYSPEAQAITFSVGGSPVTGEIGIQMSWVADLLPEYYGQYRRSPIEFIRGNLFTALKGCYTNVVEDAGLTPSTYQSSRTTIAGEVQTCLQNKFPTVQISQLSLLGQPTYTSEIQESIDKQFAAAQRAQEARFAKEEAQQQAQANLAKAQGEAAVEIEKARAEAEAARLRASTVTPEFLRLEELRVREIEATAKYGEKWNGQLPSNVVQGNNVQVAAPAQ